MVFRIERLCPGAVVLIGIGGRRDTGDLEDQFRRKAIRIDGAEYGGGRIGISGLVVAADVETEGPCRGLAEQLGLGEAAVMTQLFRARQKLKGQLGLEDPLAEVSEL